MAESDSTEAPFYSQQIPVLSKPVVLVGLMGSGKSSIGRRLARAIHAPFFDSDNVVAEAAACSITDIFEIYGEHMFRDLEKRVMLRLLTEEKPAIIATGGGAFMQPEIREAVKKHAVSIWLKADLEILLDRVSRKKNRPLLERGDDKAKILQELIDVRYPVYAEADITIHSDQGAHENVLEQVIETLCTHFPTTQQGNHL